MLRVTAAERSVWRVTRESAANRGVVIDPGPSFPAGVYFFRLQQGAATARAKITLIR